ncbi:MAG: hypothetical protein M3Y49_04880, partial [Actinomycetota bacterium]|nr:hypothetical protein [Actinomycetota bacterium]
MGAPLRTPVARVESDPSVFLSSRYTVAVPVVVLLVASGIIFLIGWNRAAETCLGVACVPVLFWV